ncbi:MAG TPA: STAS domain-containing protein [Marinagarivorans sp.]
MSQSVELELPEILTVAHVQALHEQLEALIDDENNDSIVAHAKSVRRVDTAGLQLLLAAKAAATERQITWVWDQPSEVLLDGARLLGMTAQLDIQ